MMQEGSVDGGDMEGDKKPPVKDKPYLSVCDESTNDFRNTWLTLKEVHDKDVHRLQAKLTNLRKQQLADGRWTGSTAKIKELTEQQKVFSATIKELQDKLRSKTCERCTENETFRNTLQQEFYDIQQQNLKFIADITAERNNLREENKMLNAKLKLNQKQILPSFSDSDDDFIPCSNKPMSVFSVRDPTQRNRVYLPVQLRKQSNTGQMKSGLKKEQQERPNFPTAFHSQDLFEVPETSFEKISSNISKPNTGGISDTKSSASFPLIFAQSPQKKHELQVSNISEGKPCQPNRKPAITQKTSLQKRIIQKDVSWSLSSVSSIGKIPTMQIVSETSEENMPDNKTSSLPSHTQRKGTLPLNVFPFDYTLSGKRRSSVGIPRYNIGWRDASIQAPSYEQSSLRKNSNDSTGAGANRPQANPQSSSLGYRIKRKAKTQSERKRK